MAMYPTHVTQLVGVLGIYSQNGVNGLA